MASPARQKETLTPKGQRTRVRIVDAAAQLIHERGVTATTSPAAVMSAQSGGRVVEVVAGLRRLARARANRRPAAVTRDSGAVAIARL